MISEVADQNLQGRAEAGSSAALCTIASQDQWPQVRVLADSLRSCAPEIPLYVLILDMDRAYDEDIAPPGVYVLNLSMLSIPHEARFAFQYTPTERSLAARSYLLRYLLGLPMVQKALYVEPATLVLQSPDTIFTMLDVHPVVMASDTESSLYRPAPMRKTASVTKGFLAVAAASPAYAFLDAWQMQWEQVLLRSGSRSVLEFQTWLDTVPDSFESVLFGSATLYPTWQMTRIHPCVFRRGNVRLMDETIALMHFPIGDLDAVEQPTEPLYDDGSTEWFLFNWYRRRLTIGGQTSGSTDFSRPL